jgi:hypothetical protein
VEEREYLETRLEDQLAWYERKANAARRNYKALRATEFVSAALVPVAVVLGITIYHRLAAAGLGALAATTAGLQSVNHYQENWVEYRAVAERLKSERYAYLARSAPYDGPEPLKALVDRVEGLLCGEHESWGDRMYRSAGPKKRPDYLG